VHAEDVLACVRDEGARGKHKRKNSDGAAAAATRAPRTTMTTTTTTRRWWWWEWPAILHCFLFFLGGRLLLAALPYARARRPLKKKEKETVADGVQKYHTST
jgi:hypothetical protein